MVERKLIEQMLPQAFAEMSESKVGRAKLSGKVRDWYELGDGQRMIVTTDRLSAFDRVLAAVPWKGQVLNQLSAWWNGKTSDIMPNHLVSVPDPNVSIVHIAKPLPVEIIVRGYITGVTSTALWHRYSIGERNIYGYEFPEGLRKNQRLAQPIITPTTKGGATGHDERLTCFEVTERGYVEPFIWEKAMKCALALYRRGVGIAEKAGLILVDTKYEFGLDSKGQLMLIDEIHTPDSSRFWKLASYESRFGKGEEPELFDKEFVRLKYVEQGYRGDGEPPELPESVWVDASLFYQQVLELLTGEAFKPGAYPVEPRIRDNLFKAGVCL
ncbi:MAG: phosphoribosylaminoimidazolesuccinocarboxamide synthase [Spirochaetaceae bacterium]|nr:phosphoribosylaminoimidazolesuccinocarboxamide synthase [Spirochaetaceae bacterium]